jgi:cell division protein ZipA
VLEIAIITIFIVITFALIAWFAIKRTQKRNHDFLVDLAQKMEPELTGGDEFTSIFEEELQHQIDLNVNDIEAEPSITLSESAQTQVQVAPMDTQAHIKSTASATHRVDLTVDDDMDEITESKVITESEKKQPSQTLAEEFVPDWDMMIAFTVLAKEGHHFIGSDLKAALESISMTFGQMNLYHRTTTGANKKTLFSIANIIEPGMFEPNNSASMNTPGILIFAKLPGPINGLTLFDDVLEAATQLADKLDGTLCDEQRQPISQSHLESMRSQILSLNFTLQSEQQ